jgi:hypothetical protein
MTRILDGAAEAARPLAMGRSIERTADHQQAQAPDTNVL